MKYRTWMTVVMCGGVTALVGSRVLSQDAEKQGEVDPMMAKMMEYAATGEHHAHLKVLEGDWNCKVKFWMAPDTEPQESTGTMERKWMLGGRYLREEYQGQWMDAPLEGFGIIGYDNHQKKHFTLWMDNMGTGFFTETGTCDQSGKAFTFTGNNFDPMLGKNRSTKTTLDIINNDKHVMKMIQKDENGKSFTSFEMIVTRK